MICDLRVRRDDRYVEVVPDKIWQKTPLTVRPSQTRCFSDNDRLLGQW